MISATVTFKLGSKPAQITLERASDKNPWRFLSADAALVLVPVCGHSARIVEVPPLFERLEVWPCAWGFPADLAEAHSQAVEQLRREHAAAKDGLAWDEWFRRFGKEELWRRVATDEMHRAWLNTADCYGAGPGPGFALYLWAKPDTTPWPCIAERDLLRIRFRADFHNGDRGETIYLADCLNQPLTPEEVQASPAFAAEQARRIAELNQVADRLERNAGEVAKATQIADLYSDPSYLDATVAAVKRRVPKSFVEYCKSQLHGGGKFPSTDQAHRALKTLPLLKPLRKETDQRTTCSRWLKVVHEELHKRGLGGERGRVGERGAKRAACTVEQAEAEVARVAQRTVTLEEAEEAQERGGRADRDTRTQELSEPELPDR